jgi:glycosyltransferase involved in cell wall biosynthesis
MQPRVTIVIPAYNEDESIVPTIERIVASLSLPHEVIVVVDSLDDSTVPVVIAKQDDFPTVRVEVQSYGRGPANAIRYGIDSALAPCVVVTMADGSDDPQNIDDLVRLVERGCVVAAASRYMPGGQQIGGPRIKKLMSMSAGRSLHLFAGVGTRDATNSFKAYSRDFVRRVGIDSRDGFEIGLELVAKARRLRLPIAEIPTIWLDRDAGISNFQLRKWMPSYLHWYRFAYGPHLSYEDLDQQRSGMERT